MLALTKKTCYGIIAMTHMAKMDDGALASARDISEQFGLSSALLMNVLKELAANGYVASVRGAHGGYRLAHRPDKINLADLIAVIEGPVRQASCVTKQTADGHECTIEMMACCPVNDPVHRVHRKLNDFLKKVTLAEIVEPTLVLKDMPHER